MSFLIIEELMEFKWFQFYVQTSQLTAPEKMATYTINHHPLSAVNVLCCWMIGRQGLKRIKFRKTKAVLFLIHRNMLNIKVWLFLCCLSFHSRFHSRFRGSEKFWTPDGSRSRDGLSSNLSWSLEFSEGRELNTAWTAKKSQNFNRISREFLKYTSRTSVSCY